MDELDDIIDLLNCEEFKESDASKSLSKTKP